MCKSGFVLAFQLPTLLSIEYLTRENPRTSAIEKIDLKPEYSLLDRLRSNC